MGESFCDKMKTSAVVTRVVLLLLVCCFVRAHQTLVVVDDFSMESTHSMFFKSLTDRGYDLTFHKASDSDIPFRDHGEFLFDSLIVFAPKTVNWNEMDFSVNTV